MYPEQKNFKARLLFTRLATDSKIPLNPPLKKGENIKLSSSEKGETNENWFYTYNWTIYDLDKIESEINKIVDEIRVEQI